MPVTSYLYVGGLLFNNTNFYRQVSNKRVYTRIIFSFLIDPMAIHHLQFITNNASPHAILICTDFHKNKSCVSKVPWKWFTTQATSIRFPACLCASKDKIQPCGYYMLWYNTQQAKSDDSELFFSDELQYCNNRKIGSLL